MYDVITIGSATRDVFLKSKAFHILKEQHLLSNPIGCFVLGEKIVVEEVFFGSGGSATNTAVSFARKGLKTACFTSVGDDFNGRAIIEELNSEGIATNFIQIHSGAITDYATILHAESGERTILVYKNASTLISLDEKVLDTLKAKWFYVGTVNGKINLLKLLFEYAKKAKIKIAFNPGHKELNYDLSLIKEILKGVNILLLNLDEASMLTKVHKEDIRLILKKLRGLYQNYVIVTDGKNGSYVSNGRYYLYSTTFPEYKVVDRTGAGDAFGSGFIYGLIKTGILEQKLFDFNDEALHMQECLRIANANATSIIEKVGAKNNLLTDRQLQDSRWHINYLKIKKDFL